MKIGFRDFLQLNDGYFPDEGRISEKRSKRLNHRYGVFIPKHTITLNEHRSVLFLDTKLILSDGISFSSLKKWDCSKLVEQTF